MKKEKERFLVSNTRKMASLFGLILILSSCLGDNPVSPCGDPKPYFPDQAAKLAGYWEVVVTDSGKASGDTLFMAIITPRAKPACTLVPQLRVYGLLGEGFPELMGDMTGEEGYYGTGYFLERGHIRVYIEHSKEWVKGVSYNGTFAMESDTVWSGEYNHRWHDYLNDEKGTSSGFWTARKANLLNP